MDRNEQNTLGNIFLSHRAICSIVSHAAQTSYGIVGLAPKNLAAGIAAAITKDSTQGAAGQREISGRKDDRTACR